MVADEVRHELAYRGDRPEHRGRGVAKGGAHRAQEHFVSGLGVIDIAAERLIEEQVPALLIALGLITAVFEQGPSFGHDELVPALVGQGRHHVEALRVAQPEGLREAARVVGIRPGKKRDGAVAPVAVDELIIARFF